MLALFAAALPVLFWQQGVDTAPELQNAGITHIAVPASDAAHWKTIAAISVEPTDLKSVVKLPTPGVTFRMDEASASRVPWLTSNGWRFLRQPKAEFSYDVQARDVPLAAAEAFSYSANAVISTDANGIRPLAKMLDFLRKINSDASEPIADIGFVDDGSAVSAEVMNLMTRDNLLFRIVPSTQAKAKLIVQLGSKDYPRPAVKDTDSIVHRIRANLTDDRRSLRIYGTSVVVARLTGDPEKPRLHLLNYGAAARTRVQGFRVRVLGRYSKPEFYAFGSPGEKLLDYEVLSEATEFTVPELKTYAVIDLAP